MKTLILILPIYFVLKIFHLHIFICNLAKKQPKKFWKTLKKKYKQNQKNSETLTADDLLNHFKTVFGNDRGEAEPVHHEAQTHAQGHEHNQEQAHPYTQTQSDTQPHTTAQDYAQTTPPQHEHGPQPTLHPELDAEITEAELREAIFHQKNNKAQALIT